MRYTKKGCDAKQSLNQQFSFLNYFGQAGLAEFDSFPRYGTERDGMGPRYKEKRLTRLFSKKIEYQVKKAHANERPRVKVCLLARSSIIDLISTVGHADGFIGFDGFDFFVYLCRYVITSLAIFHTLRILAYPKILVSIKEKHFSPKNLVVE